jgi:ParB family transcriptional regulator, chromosome partitioning protein
LTDHLGVLRDTNLLSEAEAVFAPPQPKQSKPKNASKSKAAPALVKPAQKNTAKKQKAT